MKKSKVILDKSCCGKIRDSANRVEILSFLAQRFRFVVSVLTLWELLDTIQAGDGRFFERDRDLLKIADGNVTP